MLDLSGLDRPDRATVPSTGSEDWDARIRGPQDAAEGLHPSLYLRLALSWGQDVDDGGFLGKKPATDVSLFRVLDSSLLDRIKSDINRNTSTNTPSARPSMPTVIAEDQAMRNRIAAWQAQDQAVSLELGFDPSGLALVDTNGAANPEPSSGEHQERRSVWKDAAARAFSTEGDAREANLLEAFVFRDQVSGEIDDSRVEWRTQEQSHVILDQNEHSIPLENVQEAEL